MKNNRFTRVDFQVSILAAIIVIIACSIIFVITYKMTYSDMIQDLHNRAKYVSDYVENAIDLESFDQLNSHEDENLDSYTDSRKMLKHVREVTGLRYLYTAKKTDSGEYIYLVDGLDADSSDFRHVGDPIEEEIIKDMESALQGEEVMPNKIIRTSWGDIFDAYIPVYEDGKIVGVVGMEFDAGHQYVTFFRLKLLTPIVIIFACILAAFVAAIMFRRISNPTFHDLANTDMLTQVKNRNAFETDLNNTWRFNERLKTGFLCIDLDYLKKVNDSFGHQTGDRYIQISCDLLREFASEANVLYRTGGDEFIMVVRNADINVMEELKCSILQRVAENNQNPNKELEISLSIGFAVYDKEIDTDIEGTWKRADDAMYADKREKRS